MIATPSPASHRVRPLLLALIAILTAMIALGASGLAIAWAALGVGGRAHPGDGRLAERQQPQGRPLAGEQAMVGAGRAREPGRSPPHPPALGEQQRPEREGGVGGELKVQGRVAHRRLREQRWR